MSVLRRTGLLLATLLAIFLIAGCAFTTKARDPIDPNSEHWQGRMALKVQSTPPQLFSADFDLQGNAQAGSLAFTSALGNTLGRLQWTTDAAILQTSGAPQHFNSLDALTRHTLGTDLPVASLFSWLKGVEVDTPDWHVDLQDLPAGRLSARRVGTDTPAELKIILQR